jgi:hypothetical protein
VPPSRQANTTLTSRWGVYLTRAAADVRRVYGGKITYASLIWEQVEWSLVDAVGVDHYWDERIKDRYTDMLNPLLATGNPVVVTEFGFRTYWGVDKAGAVGLGNADSKTLFLHQLPLVGRFIRLRLKVVHERDEGLQARGLRTLLGLVDDAGECPTFVTPVFPYNDNPLYDLDRDNFSLVKSYTGKRHDTTYPEMPWEPKEAFQVVADYYAR